MAEESNLRDYGFGDSPKVEGVPKVMGYTAEPCPNCGCTMVFKIEVVLKEAPPQLRVPEGHHPTGVYVGCPACPWASPMMTSARPTK